MYNQYNLNKKASLTKEDLKNALATAGQWMKENPELTGAAVGGVGGAVGGGISNGLQGSLLGGLIGAGTGAVAGAGYRGYNAIPGADAKAKMDTLVNYAKTKKNELNAALKGVKDKTVATYNGAVDSLSQGYDKAKAETVEQAKKLIALMEQNPEIAGAVLGAVGGAGIGGVAGRDAKSALIGAGIGGATGAASGAGYRGYNAIPGADAKAKAEAAKQWLQGLLNQKG